ncbi:MAG: PIG-L family deacetylase [Verrucomicrobiota bacterium]|nr:PIG-L family deacetylase [Verrucomicrobiota bacterium]
MRLRTVGKSVPLGKIASINPPAISPDAPSVLIFSPHPDDECIIGGLPLRMLRQCGMKVINVAVTQGRKKERKAERWDELRAACEFIGFKLMQTCEGGLDNVTTASRENEKSQWNAGVEIIARILTETSPIAIFYPHKDDWNSAHIGTHWMVMDALATLSRHFSCHLFETEFWGQNRSPNLLVELGVDEVADLVAALSFHVGEVKRNPYHLTLTSWMQDNVRRGGELVGGQGGAAPDFVFGTLYQQRRWANGELKEVDPRERFLSLGQNPELLFEFTK